MTLVCCQCSVPLDLLEFCGCGCNLAHYSKTVDCAIALPSARDAALTCVADAARFMSAPPPLTSSPSSARLLEVAGAGAAPSAGAARSPAREPPPLTSSPSNASLLGSPAATSSRIRVAVPRGSRLVPGSSSRDLQGQLAAEQSRRIESTLNSLWPVLERLLTRIASCVRRSGAQGRGCQARAGDGVLRALE